ncbi:twin-arginine translocase TatA/TatE family subunit [Demequina globuliformis]|uniref:twin-arginine translocase TatA/TatE family subunit n=1 Tax=Demequina globuliformis TaxID=676202 RepID=UPI000A03F8DB|nr:twin-arginine translocase TatA/TatE family subunit [Demequina globuliformis]
MGPRELIIILVIVLLLFGAPKLPELARSIGKSLNILKEETKSLTDDDKKTKADGAPAPGNAPGSTTSEPSTSTEASDDEGRGK